MSEADPGIPRVDEFVADAGGGVTTSTASGQERATSRWSDEEWREWNAGWRSGSWWWSRSWGDSGESAESSGRQTLYADRGQNSSSSAAEQVSAPDGAAVPHPFRDPWRDWQPGGQSWNEAQRDWSRQDQKWMQKGDYTDPPPWGGWSHYRLWKKALQRWDRNTDVMVWRRAEKVLKTMDYELQSKLDHLPESDLADDRYLNAIISVLDVIAGEKETSERRRNVRAALYEGARRPDETLAQYALRRDAQFSNAEQFISIPSELKGYMLEEQSGLSRQSLQNLRVLTGGQHEYSQVRKALQIMDIEEESIIKSQKNNFFENDGVVDEQEDSEDDETDLILYALEEKDLNEEDALVFLAEFHGKKRSWQENKRLKAARKKDRRHFDDKSTRSGRPPGRRNMSIEELKRVTRCKNCDERGHWKEECPHPYRPKGQKGGSSSASNSSKGKRDQDLTAFAFLGMGDPTASSYNFFLKDVISSWAETFSWLVVPAGNAIVDPGASQDIIVEKAYEALVSRLSERGLKPIVLDEVPSEAAGIGGKAKALFSVLSPCVLGGQPGIVKLNVIEGEVPHLLSVGLLEFAKSIIDTGENKITFKAFGCEAPLIRLDSGHRILDIADWQGGTFPVPTKVTETYGIKPGSFNLEDSASAAYDGAAARGREVTLFATKYFSDVGDSLGWSHDMFGQPRLIEEAESSKSYYQQGIRDDFQDKYPWRACWFLGCNQEHKLLIPFSRWSVADGAEDKRHTKLASSGVDLELCKGRIITVFLENKPVLNDFSDSDAQLLDRVEGVSCTCHPCQVASSISHHVTVEPTHHVDCSCSSHVQLARAFSLGSESQARGSNHSAFGLRTHEVQCSTGRPSIRRCGFGGSSEQLVQNGSKDCNLGREHDFEEDCFRASQVRSSARVRGEWSESVGGLDPMPFVPDEVELQAIRAGKSSTIKDQEPEGSCCDHNICSQTRGGDQRQEEREGGSSLLQSGDDASGDAGDHELSHEGSSGRLGNGHESGHDSYHTRSTSSPRELAEHDALAVAESGPSYEQPRHSAIPSYTHGDYLPESGDSSSRSGHAGGLGVSWHQVSSCAMSLKSFLKTFLSSSPVVFPEEPLLQLDSDFSPWDHWMAASLKPYTVRKIARGGKEAAVLWQPGNGETFLFWKDVDFSENLLINDCNDDHEFQVKKKDKRDLYRSAVEIGEADRKDSEERQTAREVDPRTQELRQTAREEDPRTQESNKTAREPDPRTGQERQTAREPDPRTGQDDKTAREPDPRTGQTAREPDPRTGQNDKTAREPDPRTGQTARESDPRTDREVGLLRSSLPGRTSLLKLSETWMARDISEYKVCELFSPPRISTRAKKSGLLVTEPSNFDLETGWNFFNAVDRANFWRTLREQEPDLVVMSPECKAFSILMNSNWSKMDKNKRERMQAEGLAMLHFCVQVAEFQLEHKRQFLIEHPAGASSWSTHAISWLLGQSGVTRFLFDQCALGLTVKGDLPSRKTTAVVTSHVGIASLLSQYQCPGNHSHVQLEGGLPHAARCYPKEMVNVIVQGMLQYFPDSQGLCLVGGLDENREEEDLEEELDAEVERADIRNPSTPAHPQAINASLSEEQKRKVTQVHINMGHLPRDQLLLLLKASGAKSNVLEFVKHQFSCESCMKQRRPIERRRAALPRTFSFNRILGIDYFYIPVNGRTEAFLNIVCHGTNFQQVGRLERFEGGSPNSSETWKLLERIWLRPFGYPETILTDGGSEFKRTFERQAELAGIMHIVSDAHSPWQNGRVERHGGWVKEKLQQELEAGQGLIRTVEELEEMITALICNKNQYFHRGGYSPSQLVFGTNPRVPTDLLSDDPMDIVGLESLQADAFEQDTPGAEFNKRHLIRQRAKELCVKSSAKDKVRLSSSQRIHRQRNWAIGQWVFVWRRMATPGEGNVTKSRWSGPGIVIMQSGHTVWVSLRSRLLKCNSDQLRAATHHETIGAELARAGELQEIVRQANGPRAGAIDITSEESAPNEADNLGVPTVGDHPTIVAPQQQEANQPSEESGEQHRPGVGTGQILRDINTIDMDQPIISRRSSVRTLEEPQGEPAPVVANPAPEESDTKRRRTETQEAQEASAGTVRQQVIDIEEIERARLEREALKELRRLEREEKKVEREERKQQKLAGTIATTSSRQDSGTASSSSARSSQLPAVPEESVDDDLFESGDNFLEYVLVKIDPQTSFLAASPPKGKNGEFNMKEATQEERQGFGIADAAEWDAIVSMGAVKVHTGEQAKDIRKRWPYRIISSRMIRRKKPIPGIGNYKFKSRWCVHGHTDPDGGTFQTYSPMPSTESINLFFQVCLNEELSLSFADIKNAFCQADRLDRSQGPVYVTPCEGLSLSSDALVELIAPVYGLDDAPLRWHHTLVTFFEGLGFTRSLLEPCWMVKRAHGKIVAQVLIEVDDINIGCIPSYMKEFRQHLEKRFVFGKWEFSEADFAGRHVRMTDDKIVMDQEKYIIEKLIPFKLGKGRSTCKQSPLDASEFEIFRSLLYRVNWVAHQTRPEAAGVVSILASRLKAATIHDFCCLNRLIVHLRNTAKQPLTLHKFKSKDMVLISASDAGGVDGVSPGEEIKDEPLSDTIQGAWLIMASDRMPSASSRTKVSILSWRSSKLKRRVSSTLASEALAFTQALGELEWMQIMLRDIIYGDVSRSNWKDSITPFVSVLRKDCKLHQKLQQCSITDAKSLFDAINRKNPASRQDRRTAIELAIILETMETAKAVLRWTPHPRMVADGLTKDNIDRTNGALEELLKTSKLSLWDEKQELDLRKNSPQTKNRSKKASSSLRDKDAEMCLLNLFSEVQVNKNWWELFHDCSTFDH